MIQHMTKIFSLILLLWVSQAFATDPVVVATVNGDQITTDMMANEIARIHSVQTEQVSRSGFSVDRLLQRLINDRLLIQDAYALGINEERDVVDAVHWFRETSAYQMLLEDITPKDIKVSDEELREAFNKYYRRAMLRLICVVDSSLSASIADSIHSGVSMASLSARYAIDKYKSLGGDAGVFPLYDIPEDLAERIESVPQGELVGPMFLWDTWTVVRADAFLPPDETMYDSVKVILQKQIMIDKGAQMRRATIAREAADIPVWADSSAVNEIPALVAAGQDPKAEPVLRVGQTRELLASDLKNKFIHRTVGQSNRDKHDAVWEVFDEQYQVMMLKEIAKKKSYIDDPRLDKDAEAFRDSMMLVTYLRSVVAPTIKISDAEIKEFYDANPNEFFDAGRVRVAIITRETLAEAQADYDKLLTGADFAWMAKQYSTDEYKDRGGVRDWATMSEFPREIAAQIDTLAIGGYLPPLSGDEGFVVIKLIEREQGRRLSLDVVKPGIRTKLESKKQYAAIDATITELRADSEIKINEDVLHSLQVSGPQGN
jgi:parvulin-like peptidyl-prolyl isomerase